MSGWVSPRLGIRFEPGGRGFPLFHADGGPFVTFLDVQREAEAERTRAESERARAESERARAESERARAESEHARAEKLAAQLRALGMEPEA